MATMEQVEKSEADKILEQVKQQLETSRKFKKSRIEQIKENENLYLGIVPKSIRNPFNENFPFMAGFVDHLRAKIDDDSTLLFTHRAEADLKKAQKINAFYEDVSQSVAPNAAWDLKHRWAKNNAIFSGVAIYKKFATSIPKFTDFLYIVSHYDFHCEPRGGGMIQNHLFCGEENVPKSLTDMEAKTEIYDKGQVAILKTFYEEQTDKQVTDSEQDRDNRAEALGLQPQDHTFIGNTGVINLVEFYTTYKGKRYYILFDYQASVWVRCHELVELFPDNDWPYVTWQTNEDPDVFWSKAPADDARPIAKIMNTMINQELYNRQKRNQGQRGFDVEMFPNVEALANWRPDGLVPVDTKGGTRTIGSGVYEFKVGDLNGTLDLVTWLDQFTGKQTGHTSAGAGQSEDNKKVGVFQGEIQQIEQLINVKNKSYRTALSQIGLFFKRGLDQHLTEEISVKVMGGKGVEWQKLTPADLKLEDDLVIQPIGGTSEIQLKEIKSQRKMQSLSGVMTVNPQWKDRQLLLLNGWDEGDVKEAFQSESFAEKELMSEAAIAEREIVEGKQPELNRGANAAYIQHLIDFEKDTDDLPDETRKALLDFAFAHQEIAVGNEHRNIQMMMKKRAVDRLSNPSLSTGRPATPAGSERGIINDNGRPNITGGVAD